MKRLRNFIFRGFNHLPNKGFDAKNTTECCSCLSLMQSTCFQSFKPTKKNGLSRPEEVGGVRKSLVVERRPGKNRRLGASMVTDSYYRGFFFIPPNILKEDFRILNTTKIQGFRFSVFLLFFFHL